MVRCHTRAQLGHTTEWGTVSQPRARVAIIGGGPGGYGAALVAAQLGADVTVVERDGPGGACVLSDCVPSKTLIATSGLMAGLDRSASLGIRLGLPSSGAPASDGSMAGQTGAGAAATVDAPRLYSRVRALARAQSGDVAARLAAEGIGVMCGVGRLAGPRTVAVGDREINADVVLIATGAEPRMLPGAVPDGDRLLTCRQLYDLNELPAELVVVGSGVTGAEFASAYQALGSQVTLVSSRDRVLPHEDVDAAVMVEDVFRRRGMTVLGRSRAAEAKRTRDGVAVILADGRTVRGTHCLLTVGMQPCTAGIGLEDAGVTRDDRGFVPVDRVSRTSVPGVYAAGACTGVWMLASVAAMQGLPLAIGQPHRSGTQTHAARGRRVAVRRAEPLAASVRGQAQVGVVGDVETMLTQPGGADVVGVGEDREDAARQDQRHHHQAEPSGCGQQRGEHYRDHDADRNDDHQVAERRTAAPACVGQFVPDPVTILLRQPEPDREKEPPCHSRVASEPCHCLIIASQHERREPGRQLSDAVPASCRAATRNSIGQLADHGSG